MTEKEIITIYENVVAKKYGIEFTLPDYLENNKENIDNYINKLYKRDMEVSEFSLMHNKCINLITLGIIQLRYYYIPN
jgi:hypothetical protein